jgi:hypothetical protein
MEAPTKLESLRVVTVIDWLQSRTMAAMVLGVVLFALGLLPEWAAAMARPVLITWCIASFAASIFLVPRAWLRGGRMRWSRTVCAIACGALPGAAAGEMLRLWSDGVFLLAVLLVAAMGGIALLVDAVLVARAPVSSRAQVVAAGSAGAGILVLTLSQAVGREVGGTAWSLIFLSGIGLLLVASVAFVRLDRAARARARLLAEMGLGS